MEGKTLQETIQDIMVDKVTTICKSYCKYYEQCYAEQPDDYKEENIWDECPLIEFFN